MIMYFYECIGDCQNSFYSDKYKHANESCISQFISKRQVKKLIQENVLSPAKAALLDGVVVIAKDDTIVTVFHKKIRFQK